MQIIALINQKGRGGETAFKRLINNVTARLKNNRIND